MANRKPYAGRKYKGTRRRGKWWYASIGGDATRERGDNFLTEEEAARDYDRMALDRWGEFAYLNFPPPGWPPCRSVPDIPDPDH